VVRGGVGGGAVVGCAVWRKRCGGVVVRSGVG